VNADLEKKVNKLMDKLAEIEQALGQPDVFDDQKHYRSLTQEHSYLSNLNSLWEKIVGLESERKDNEELLRSEEDEEFLLVLREDLASVEEELGKLQAKLEVMLVPPDPNDSRNTILEIRAGIGGDEAGLFVGDCVRMYKLFADAKGWKYEHITDTPSDSGGYKEYVMAISGENVYRFLCNEGGTHRVQRVPATETQGRVHTSAVTIATLLEPGEDEDIVLDEKDLRIDTYRASGAGGQHVNTTDSAVRITYIPTGAVAYCQQERSQHKNKDKAMRLLVAIIAEEEKQKKDAEIASTRATQVGSGDRSERIRTYNFPQNRVTDHRINLTMYNLDQVMGGSLDTIIQALVTHFYQQKLVN
jgi:peptide chain release factor 1